MATTVGTLEFQFIADIARLKQDMEEVKRSVGSTTSFIESAAATAKGALAGIAASLTIGAFAGWIKSAIDAGDATKEFSQKTGVAAKDVAGLQLAFKLGGVEGDALTSAIGKLSKNMAAGSDAFAQMGVSVRNSDGTLRSVKDVIADVAEATKAMGDGAAKSALLQQVFGKSAAALIPTLNEGAAGMREMAGEADRLGLSISAEAAEASDKFNDTLTLLGAGMQGIGQQIAAGLLPTLQNMAESFLSLMGGTDGLSNSVSFLAGLLKVLYTTAIAVIEIFQTLGEVMASIAAAAGAIWTELRNGLTGDFSAATGIINDMLTRVKTGWTDAISAVDTAWSEARNTSVPALAAIHSATNDVVIKTTEQSAAVKAATGAYESYRDKLLSYRTELNQTIAGGEKASAAQKILAELTANNTAAVMKITKERRLELIEIAKQNVELEKTAVARDTETKAIAQAMESIRGKNASLKEEIAAQTSANEQARGGADASGLLAIAKLREAAATAERTAAITLETSGNQELADQYREQANLLNQLADQKGQGIEIERAKQAAEEWKKTTDSIGQSLTDALLRGFESGAKFADVFKNTLTNMFQTLVLRPIIQPIVQGAAGLVTGALGISANASTGGGMGGLSTLSGLSTLYKAGSLFPGVEANVLNLSNQLVAQGGVLADAGLALNNAAGSLAQLPGGLVGGGLITGGAGFLGGQLGAAAFGQAGTASQLGGLGGGLAGAAFAPAALGAFGGPLGALAGSFIGSAIDSVLVGNGPETRAAVFAGSDTSKAEPKWVVDLRDAASGLKLAGEAQRVGAEGQKSVAGLVESFAQIDQTLTSLTRASGLSVDLSGATGFGSFSGKDAGLKFVRAWIDAVSGPFDSELKAAANDLVGNTAEDLINAYQSLLTIRNSIASGGIFAGLGSLQQLSQAVSPEQVQQITAFAGQIKGLKQIMTGDSVAAWEQSQRTVFELWRDQGDAIVNAAEVAASTSDFAVLTAAVQERYATEQQLIGQIMGALQSAADQFGNSYQSIFVDGLKTEQERYDYFRKQADSIAEMITTLNDPAAISAAASEYNTNLMNAYNSLSEASRDAMRADILATSEQVGALVEERLNMALSSVQADNNADVPGSVGNAIEAATDRAMENIRQTVTEAVEAVSKQQAETSRQSTELVNSLNAWAAGLPESIRVQIAGSEVAF